MSRKNRAVRPRPAWATACLALGVLLLGAPLSAQNGSGPLVVGTDVGYPPFTRESPTGGYEGFSLDFAEEIAKRMGRSGIELVIKDFAEIFDALLVGEFEMIITPTNITAERARRVLFSEGYMDTGLGFLVFRGEELRDVTDLRGEILTVEFGTVSDSWASINEAWLGFTVRRYQRNADAISAVINREAFANLLDLPVATHMAGQLGVVSVAYNLPISGKFGLVFHPIDVELWKQAENALECMKLDGTLAELHERWFGFPAGEDTATNTVYVGYGHPGYERHEAVLHVPSCG